MSEHDLTSNRAGRVVRSISGAVLILLASCTSSPAHDGQSGTSAATVGAVERSPGTRQPTDNNSVSTPATAAPDDVFCQALNAWIDFSEPVADPPASQLPSLTPEQSQIFRETLLPALYTLRDATPVEIREPVDLTIVIFEAMTSSNGRDPSQGLSAILGGQDYETHLAFDAFATQSCRLEGERLKAFHQTFPTPTNPADSCGPQDNAPRFPGWDRLLQIPDITSIKALSGSCNQIPNRKPVPAPISPCGGVIDPVDLNNQIGAHYGILIPTVIEAISTPGEEAANRLVEQLRADLKPGCPPRTVTEAGSSATMSEVVPLDLEGMKDPHVGFTGRVTGSLAVVSSLDDANVAYGVVAHGDEVLILVVISKKLPSQAELAQLLRTAVDRAGW